MECTLVAHIDTGSNALSIQNKRHLHWKALDPIPGMNNEAEFVAPAHNLLMDAFPENMSWQENKNRSTNFQASPEAARKKKFVKLNITTLFPPLFPPRVEIDSTSHAEHEESKEEHKQPVIEIERTMGLISQPAAQNRLTYD
ncbi:unnamed protein product [Sphagnum balticum]